LRSAGGEDKYGIREARAALASALSRVLKKALRNDVRVIVCGDKICIYCKPLELRNEIRNIPLESVLEELGIPDVTCPRGVYLPEHTAEHLKKVISDILLGGPSTESFYLGEEG